MVRTEDGLLWALGIGEYDRNFIPSLIPVMKYEESEDDESGRHLTMRTGSALKKGYNRVLVVERPECIVDEIILHKGEAYTKPLEVVNSRYRGGQTVSTKQFINDISIGWKHSLILTSQIPTVSHS